MNAPARSGWREWRNKSGTWVALWALAAIGAVSVASHVIDGLVWTFEPSSFVESGTGSHRGSERLLAAGSYAFKLDVTGATPSASTVQGGQAVATCLVGLSLHSQSGDAVFLPVPESVHLINGVSTSPTLLYFSVVPGTGWYDFYVAADNGCEWKLTVDKI